MNSVKHNQDIDAPPEVNMYSDIESISSVAITSLYQRLFSNTKTRFSGPLILGWDNEKLLETSLKDVYFRAFGLKVDKYLIYVTNIGAGNNKDLMGAGIGYMSSFIGEYEKKRALYLQQIEKNGSRITIYPSGQSPIIFHGETPNNAWKNVGLWLNQHSTIIELHGKLKKLYPPNYILDDRELRAWKTMLKAVGCINITPFGKNESEATIPNYIINVSKEFWKCFEKSLNHSKNENDGKIRILSIIANNFTYEELQNRLKVSSKTITKARIYCDMNGPGCSMLDKPIITRVRITEEMENQFEKFFSDKNIINLNSYRVDKNGLPLKYLKDKKETLWKKYFKLYPNGMKRTTFLTRLRDGPYLYKDDLGGLCLICAEYGYGNKLINEIEYVQRHLKREYEKELKIDCFGYTQHVDCLEHCIMNAFSQCSEVHHSICAECMKVSDLFQALITQMSQNIVKIIENQKKLQYYWAHQVRKTYLNAQFNANLLTLDENGAIIIVDYKMKILPKSAREVKSDFFGCRFTSSAFEAVFNNLDKKPLWIKIVSDNGAHYHCVELMSIIANWNSWYGIEIRDWIFLEAGEAKTTIDSHHAQIAHSIKRYIRLGHNISEGEDIVNAIKDIRGTSVANIQPNRSQREIKKPKIDGISNWFEFRWPVEGEFAGYVCARSLSHFGTWHNFSPATIQKLRGSTEQSRPNPIVSNYTNPILEWLIPLPSNNSNPNQLSIINIRKELDQRNIIYDDKENQIDLANKLQKNIQQETINKINETKIQHESYKQVYEDKIITTEIQNSKKKQEKKKTKEIRSNYFCSGWALKENQEYGKKRGGKHMTEVVKELLKIFFHTGDENKSERYTAKDMHQELLHQAQTGELEAEEIPQLKTIENWISRYSSQHKKSTAKRAKNALL
ncbi:hypothetical protein Glove_515g4 [Diversispora epigaea]|uniref:Uncharacterized protein n=1 Tax=Diversispora epigaea TaxID=1348612 RepID=A0A397GJU8_9GLOM|nr:hypothetical protein Glove_515g4 [Diversispora epigaea]